MKRSGTVWSAFRLGKLNASGDEPLVAEVGSAIPHAHGDSNHTERCLSLYLSTIYTALAAFALVLLICMPLLRRSEGWNPTWVARTPRPTLPRSGSTPHRPRTLRGGDAHVGAPARRLCRASTLYRDPAFLFTYESTPRATSTPFCHVVGRVLFCMAHVLFCVSVLCETTTPPTPSPFSASLDSFSHQRYALPRLVLYDMHNCSAFISSHPCGNV